MRSIAFHTCFAIASFTISKLRLSKLTCRLYSLVTASIVDGLIRLAGCTSVIFGLCLTSFTRAKHSPSSFVIKSTITPFHGPSLTISPFFCCKEYNFAFRFRCFLCHHASSIFFLQKNQKRIMLHHERRKSIGEYRIY